jgi:biotin carboxyl carrier protein
MIYVVNINNKEYEVEVEKGKANLIKTTDVIAPTPVSKSAAVDVLPVQVSSPVAPVSNMAGESINSPMPGTVLDIRVRVGDKVKSGQILLILEAMKMENEIFAPADGIVTQIAVTKGANVATNDILLKIQ